MTILKSSRLKSHAGRVLDRAILAPEYVERNGTLLVVTKASLIPARAEPMLSFLGSPDQISGKFLCSGQSLVRHGGLTWE